MLDLIEFEEDNYPAFQAKGNASQFAIPFAKHFCKGYGVDIGFCHDEWKFPFAVGADISDTKNNYHAHNLPSNLDFIYSSHCLEHLPDWVGSIDYWSSVLNKDSVLFMYLPHPDQKYWKPWNNRKHLHTLYPKDVAACMRKFGFVDVISSERDLNHSYCVVGSKA